MTKAAFDKIAEGLREANDVVARQLETRTLKAGQIVKIGGIPIALKADVEAETHPNNWAIAFDERVEDMPEPTGTVQEQAYRILNP